MANYRPIITKRILNKKKIKISKLLFTKFSGAETPVYLALLPPNAGKPHGEFVKDKKVQEW